ncbi:TRASH domain-containing protein [Aeromonas sp. R4-2]
MYFHPIIYKVGNKVYLFCVKSQT